jgi:hypothetical protein
MICKSIEKDSLVGLLDDSSSQIQETVWEDPP